MTKKKKKKKLQRFKGETCAAETTNKREKQRIVYFKCKGWV